MLLLPIFEPLKQMLYWGPNWLVLAVWKRHKSWHFSGQSQLQGLALQKQQNWVLVPACLSLHRLI